jgi:hypothetical protein
LKYLKTLRNRGGALLLLLLLLLLQCGRAAANFETFSRRRDCGDVQAQVLVVRMRSCGWSGQKQRTARSWCGCSAAAAAAVVSALRQHE